MAVLSSMAIFALCGYMACSSLLLIVNKLAVEFLQAPSVVLFGQMASCAFVVKACGAAGIIKVDALSFNKIKGFSLAAFSFCVLIYANIKTLQYVNVETFIVFRLSTPIPLSIADYFFLGRELPSVKSWITIVILGLGGAVYVMTDKGFHISGYAWLGVWYCVFLFDQLFLKYVVDNVKMDSNWGRVYYQNFLCTIPLAVMFFINGDYQIIQSFTWTPAALFAFCLSMVLGIAMSYFAWLARSLVSATYFSVVGNVCKVITILINVSIWDKHANAYGLSSLFVCLMAAYFYEQAPLRSTSEDLRNKKSPV